MKHASFLQWELKHFFKRHGLFRSDHYDLKKQLCNSRTTSLCFLILLVTLKELCALCVDVLISLCGLQYFILSIACFCNTFSGAVVGHTLHKIRRGLCLFWTVDPFAVQRESHLCFLAIKYLLCCLQSFKIKTSSSPFSTVYLFPFCLSVEHLQVFILPFSAQQHLLHVV